MRIPISSIGILRIRDILALHPTLPHGDCRSGRKAGPINAIDDRTAGHYF